jgi:hypothetical protein
MKTAFFALFISLPVFANTTCFTRDVEIRTNEVSLSRELCFGDIELQLDIFAPSKAVVKFTNDGKTGTKTVELKHGRDRGDGTVAFKFNVESNVEGGGCGDTWEATSEATLLVKRDGSSASVAAVTADISYSIDNCHSDMRTQQEISYRKN